jgi:hypothetical protein
MLVTPEVDADAVLQATLLLDTSSLLPLRSLCSMTISVRHVLPSAQR